MEIFTEEELEYMISKLHINKCTPRELPNSSLYLIGSRGLNTILMKTSEGNKNSITLFSSRFPDRTNTYIAKNLNTGLAYDITTEMVYTEKSENPLLYTYWKNSTLKPLVRSDFNDWFEKFQDNENTLNRDVGWSGRNNYKDESGIYALFYDHGFKIGISKNIKKRVKNYDKPWNIAPISTKTATCDYVVAKEIEKIIKKELKHFTIKGSTEFFYTSCVDESIDTLDVVWKMALNKISKSYKT